MRAAFLFLFFIQTLKSWAQTPDATAELNFTLSKGFTALEHLQYERSFAAFKRVWQITAPGQKMHPTHRDQHLFACEGLAWVYYGRMDANPDSVNYYTRVPYLKSLPPLHQFRLRYVQARAYLPKAPEQALQAFQQLLKDHGKSLEQAAQLWYHIGVCHQDLKQWKLAEIAFNRCIQVGGETQTWVIGRGLLPFIARLALVDVALKMNQVQVAEKALMRAQNNPPVDFQSTLELNMRQGELAISKKQYPLALQHFGSAAQILENWIKQEEILESDEAMLREDYAQLFSNAAWCALQSKQVYLALNWIEKGKNQLLQRRWRPQKTAEINADQVQQILHKLDAPYTILRYFQARDSIFAAVLSSHACHIQVISDTTGLSQHIFALHQLDPQQIDYAEHYTYYSSWLYQYFVEPLENRINTKHLLIIPDGALNLLSFESLCTRPDPAQMPFLLRRYAIWYAPGLYFLQYSQQQVILNQRWLGLAPDFRNHPTALPLLQFNQREIEQARRLTDGVALVGDEARKVNWLQEFPQRQHLHFSTHGVLSNQNSNFNQMILAPNQGSWDSLTVAEVKKLDFKGKDIVLSTCYAGLSRYILYSEEMNSLSRAFLSVGATSVLQSTWRLPDMASFVIISEYYRLLKQGKDQASALQEAKLHYLDEAEDLRDRYQLETTLGLSPLPHHWNMIVGYGWPHQIRFVAANQTWIMCVVAGIAGLFFLAFLFLRGDKKISDHFAPLLRKTNREV